jgi:predicted Zn-dependent protease
MYTFRKSLVFGLWSLVFGLSLGGCVTTEYSVATHQQDIFLYSTDREIALGQNLSRQISKKFKISNNPFYVRRVNEVGAKITRVCDRGELKYYFYVIDEDKMNAFSLPGGYVYIYKGLLDALDNDSQLAFVLAHEVAHIVARHSIKKLQAVQGLNLLILATLGTEKPPRFYQGLSLALAQIMAGYSQADELTADELAAKYIKLAGFLPQAGIEVLEKLYAYHKKESSRPLSYFRIHPSIAQRVKRIKEVSGIPLTISDYINQ